MSDVLAALDVQLRPLLTRYGFAPADPEPSIVEDCPETIRLLEYRRSAVGRAMLRLDVCQVVTAGTIGAELWSPPDPARVTTETTVNDVALQRHVWRYDAPRDPCMLVQEIVVTIATWCDGPRNPGCAEV